MRVLAIQHIDCEPLGSLESVLSGMGAVIEYVRPHAGEPLPARLAAWDAAVILGGPMAVYADDVPFMDRELELVAGAIRDELPLLGICLGSQIIAAAAGARVFAGTEREIGWSEVQLSAAAEADPLLAGLPRQLSVFQLHGDSFELPEGALHLAGSPAYENQAFRIGANAYGLQFHVEVTPELARTWADEYRDYMAAAGSDRDLILDGLETKCLALQPSVDSICHWLMEVSGRKVR